MMVGLTVNLTNKLINGWIYSSFNKINNKWLDLQLI